MAGPIPLKYVVLVLLVLQNSLTAILARASRVPPTPGAQLYLGSVAVLVAEIMKLPVACAMIVRDEGGVLKMLKAVWKGVFVNYGDTLRMGVPALCYGLQNALYFVALSNLSATTYQLWSQTKTLFTALFFVRLLGAELRTRQWTALGLLTAGVALVQLEEGVAAGGAAPIRPSNSAIRSVGEGVRPRALSAALLATTSGVRSWLSGGVVVGVLAVVASAILSGFANVYFERLLKQAECEYDDSCDIDGARTAPMSLWMRNVQLAVFSIPQAALLMLCNAYAPRAEAHAPERRPCPHTHR